MLIIIWMSWRTFVIQSGISDTGFSESLFSSSQQGILSYGQDCEGFSGEFLALRNRPHPLLCSPFTLWFLFVSEFEKISQRKKFCWQLWTCLDRAEFVKRALEEILLWGNETTEITNWTMYWSGRRLFWKTKKCNWLNSFWYRDQFQWTVIKNVPSYKLNRLDRYL